MRLGAAGRGAPPRRLTAGCTAADRLTEDDLMIAARVEVGQPRNLPIVRGAIEPPRPHIGVPRRRLDIEAPAAAARDRLLGESHEASADAEPLGFGCDRDP